MIESAFLGWLLLIGVAVLLLALAVVLYASIVIGFALLKLSVWLAITLADWSTRAAGTSRNRTSRWQ